MSRGIYRWIPGLGIIFGAALGGTALARPPTEIILNYDPDMKILHVEARHVTKNPRKHFIRQIVVYRNDVEAEKRLYVQQTTGAMLTEDVAIDAVTDDVLRVEAVCIEAGRKETTLVIP